MELTRRRKAGLAAAAIAVMALVADRVTGGGASPLGPASAQASAERGTAPATPESAPKPRGPSLRTRLETARSQSKLEVSDAFSPPKAWVVEVRGAVPEGAERSAAERAALLAGAHRLTGVSMGARKVAVIDGVAFTLGATREGLTLRSIAENGRSVVIEREGVEATLMLDQGDH